MQHKTTTTDIDPTADREKLLKILDSIWGLAETLKEDMDRSRANLEAESFLHEGTANSIVVAIQHQAFEGYVLAEDADDEWPLEPEGTLETARAEDIAGAEVEPQRRHHPEALRLSDEDLLALYALCAHSMDLVGAVEPLVPLMEKIGGPRLMNVPKNLKCFRVSVDHLHRRFGSTMDAVAKRDEFYLPWINMAGVADFETPVYLKTRDD